MTFNLRTRQELIGNNLMEVCCDYPDQIRPIIDELVSHLDNNQWFQSMRDQLTDSGILYVPILDKEFNKLGEEVNTYNSNEGD